MLKQIGSLSILVGYTLQGQTAVCPYKMFFDILTTSEVPHHN
jgi:hypothetical protein